MYCSQCGVEGHGGFCSACGAKLASAPKPSSETASLSTTVPKRTFPRPSTKVSALAALGIVAVLLVAGFFLTRSKVPVSAQGQVTTPTTPAAVDPVLAARATCYTDVGDGVAALVEDSHNVSAVVRKYGSETKTFAMIREIWPPVQQEEVSFGMDAGLQKETTLVRQACDAANPDPVSFIPDVTTPTVPTVAAPVPTEEAPAKSSSPDPPLTMGKGPNKVGCNIGASACAFENGIDFADVYKRVGAGYTRKWGDGVDGVNCDSGESPNHVPVGKHVMCKITGSVAEGQAKITVTASPPFWHLDSIRLIPEGE
jgi:hypothetical protein